LLENLLILSGRFYSIASFLRRHLQKSKTTMVAVLEPGVVVTGHFGYDTERVTNADGSQTTKRKRKQFEGRIIEAVGPKKWLVQMPNGERSLRMILGLVMLLMPMKVTTL
jgi:hypothetical protein